MSTPGEITWSDDTTKWASFNARRLAIIYPTAYDFRAASSLRRMQVEDFYTFLNDCTVRMAFVIYILSTYKRKRKKYGVLSQGRSKDCALLR